MKNIKKSCVLCGQSTDTPFKTCLGSSENIVRVESFNFCIDLNFLTYGQILAYICCISTLPRCETSPEMHWGLS